MFRSSRTTIFRAVTVRARRATRSRTACTGCALRSSRWYTVSIARSPSQEDPPSMTAEQLLATDVAERRQSSESGMVAIIRSSFDARRPARRGPRTAFLRHAVQHRPRDPRPVPGEHGGAAQQAAAGARARRADGGPARRARPVPAAARPRPPQVRRARRALRRGRRRAARRHRALRGRRVHTRGRDGLDRGVRHRRERDAHGGRRPSAGPPPGWAGWSATSGSGWDLARITVQTSEAIPYRAGQYVSVETPQRPRLWRYLSPANAPRPDGSLEFHVRAVRQRLGQPRRSSPTPASATPGGSGRRWAGCSIDAGVRPRRC